MSSILSPLANIQIIHHDLTTIEQRLNDNNFKLVPKKMIAELRQIYPELLSMRHNIKNSENEAISTKAFIVWQRCYQICQDKRIQNMNVENRDAVQMIEKNKRSSLYILEKLQRKLKKLERDNDLNASQKESVKEILFLNALELDSKKMAQAHFAGLSFNTQKVIFDKVFELSNNNNQLLFTPARASSLFERFDLLTIKNAFYAIMNIKENQSESITTDHEFVVLPSSEMTLDNFSNVVLMRIFQAIKQPQDYFRLGLANKRFHAISQTSRAFKCDVVFPSYLAEAKDPAIRQLSNFEKAKMVVQNEKRLLSDDPLPILYEVSDLANLNPIPKKIIGDHLVFMPNAKGMVYIINLKTKERKKFKVDKMIMIKCEVLQTDCPLLVTVNRHGNFKIWDFNLLINLTSDDELNKALVYTDTISTIITTHGHLLVGYSGESVHILDCSKLSSTNCSNIIKLTDTLINPFRVTEMHFQFTDTHLLLFSDLKLFIYDLDTIEQTFGRKNATLEADSAIYSYSLKQPPDRSQSQSKNSIVIKFAKIYGDLVVIAYSDEYIDYSFDECPYTFGEVRNWKTGKRLRTLSHSKELKSNGSSVLKKFDAVDCYDNQLFTASNYLSGWDLNSKEVLPHALYSCFTWDPVQRVYVLGRHILFADNDRIKIKDKSLSTVKVRDSLVATKLHPKIILTSFELNGNKLMTETHYPIYVEPNRSSIVVYDLASSPEEIESPSQENKLSLLSEILEEEEREYIISALNVFE